MLRSIARGTGIALLLFHAAGVLAAAEPAQPAGGPSVRMPREFDQQWLQAGVCRSTSFRELVSDLSRSDVIVYVQPRFLATRTVAGGLLFVSASSTARILRVLINLSVIGTDRSGAIATLGHELRHALEVADAPHIRSVAAFDEYYARHQTGGRTFDTAAARQTERVVRGELYRSSSGSCPGPASPTLLAHAGLDAQF